MKGYFSVDIPTKKYIRAYIIAQLGEKPVMDTSSNIGCKLYDLLQHKVNERKSETEKVKYNSTIRIYINERLFRKRGGVLNHTNMKNFNIFLEEEIKSRFYFLMDTYIEMYESFKANLPEVRRRLGISIFNWDDDSMQKDYYRYRKAKGKPLFYKKIFSRFVHDQNNAKGYKNVN